MKNATDKNSLALRWTGPLTIGSVERIEEKMSRVKILPHKE